MRVRSRFHSLALGVSLLVAQLTAAAPWPDPPPGIEPDPAIVWGQLPNGLRYALKPQPFPPGATSLRMVVLAGSLHETKDEIGIAHFVEHMGFNGTRKFRHETLGETLEKQGIRFGPEVTAFTWPSHTIYQIDLPSSEPEKLDLGLTVLREWASEMRLDRKQVEREKGVIISESRSRGMNGNRLYQNRLQFYFPDSLLSQRPGVSAPAQVESVTPRRLREFYTRWYRPDNTLLVVAGDFDPAAMRPLLEQKFGSWTRPPTPLPTIDLGLIQNSTKTRAQLVTNPEIKTFNLELTLVEPRQMRDDLANRQRGLALSVATHALQNRLNSVLRHDPTVFGRLSITLQSPTPYAWEVNMQAEGRITDWEKITRTIVHEYLRLRQFGFLEAELAVPRAHALRQAEYATRYGATESAEGFAARTAQNLIWGNIPTSTAFHFAMARDYVPTIDAATCLEALRPFFAQGYPALLATTDPRHDLDAAQLATHLNALIKETIPPPEPPTIPEFPYTDFGPPGKIVQRTYDEPLDIHMVEFENGVKLNLKSTSFDAGSVFVQARLDNGGRLREPDNQAGLALIAQSAFIEGGLEKLDAEQLQFALAGRFAQLNFGVGEDSLHLHGSADQQELELLFQLLTAYLTDFALRPESVALAKESVLSWQNSGFLDVDRALQIRSGEFLYPEDRRFGLANPHAVTQFTPASIKAWLRWIMHESPMEIAVVGDMEVESAIALAAATVGTLPPRQAPPFFPPASLRKLGLVQGLKVESTERKISALFAWPVGRLDTARRRRTLEICSWVLQAEVSERIRESLGLAYTPDVGYWISEADPGNGFLQASVSVAPQTLRRASDEIAAIAQRLVKKGISSGDLTRAKEPVIQSVEAQLKSNRYWLRYVVSSAQTDPEALVLPHTRRHDLETISESEVESMLREILRPETQITLFATP